MWRFQCKNCKRQWYVEESDWRTVKSCPFCLAEISKFNLEELHTDTLEQIIGRVFAEYGTDIMNHRERLFSILMDLSPTFQKELKIFSKSCSQSILEQLLKVETATDNEQKRILSFVKIRLIEEEGLGEIWADRIIDTFEEAFCIKKNMQLYEPEYCDFVLKTKESNSYQTEQLKYSEGNYDKSLILYGIDFGQKKLRIAAAYAKEDDVVFQEAVETEISAVFFKTPSEVYVGKDAIQKGKLYPSKCIVEVNDFIGKVEYPISCDRVDISIERIVSSIFQKLMDDIGNADAHSRKFAVVACPWSFAEKEWKVLRKAAYDAGIEAVKFIGATEAVLHFYDPWKEINGKNSLVFDLGENHFCVAVFHQNNDGTIEMVFSDESDDIKGRSWDDKIYDYYHDQLHNFDPDSARKFRYISKEEKDAITNEILMIKKYFGNSGKRKDGFLSYFIRDKLRKFVILSEEIFNEITENVLYAALCITEHVVEMAKIQGIDFDYIFLGGMASKLYQIEEKLEEKYDIKPEDCNIINETSVALGAVYAGFCMEWDEDEEEENLEQLFDELFNDN